VMNPKPVMTGRYGMQGGTAVSGALGRRLFGR